LKVFEKLFKTSRISRLEDDTLYKWAFIEKDELDKFQDAVQNIYLGKLDGLIVKSFFSPRELERMKNGIQSIPKKDFVTTPAVSNYPIIFAQLVGR
jgi:hypothetical protein